MTGAGRPDHAGRRARHPGRPQRLERAGRGRRRAAVRHRARRDPARGGARSPASSTASSGRARSTASASSTTRRAPSPTRSSRRCARSTAPIVLIAGGRDKGVDLAELAAVVGAARRRGGAHRRERPDARAAVPRRRPRARPSARATLEEAVATRRRARPRGARATARGRAPSRPCCSARPPRASTCSRTTRPAAGRSRPRVARPRSSDGAPADRPRRPRSTRASAAPDAGGRARRPTPPARAPPARLRDPPRGRRPRRDRHPDGLFVVGDEGLPPARRHVRDRRAADLLGGARARRDGRDDADRLPLAAARVGAGATSSALVAARPRVRSRRSTSRSAAPRAGSRSGRCRRSTRPSSRSSRWSSTSPTGSRSAAARSAGFWAGTVPFLVIVVPGHRARAPRARPRARRPSSRSPRSRCSSSPARTCSISARSAAAGVAGGRAHRSLTRLPARPDPALLDPWADPLGTGFHTIQGLLALGLGGLLGRGPRARAGSPAGCSCRTPATTSSSRSSARSSGSSAAASSSCCSSPSAISGSGPRSRAPDTFGALLAAGITAWLCLQAFINIGVVVALIPVTGITLPFICAGGSSLIISFAAVGILLSISRETVERGTWNDAAADRGRGDGRTHLPGPRRRPVAPRSSRRA